MEKKTVVRADHEGDPNIGLYGTATDEFLLAPPGGLGEEVGQVLGVPVIETTIGNTTLVGLFTVANSNAILLPKIVSKRGLEHIKKQAREKRIDANIVVLDTRHTALGNLVCANNKGALVSPLLEKHKKQIEDFLGVEVVVTRITGLNIVGSVCVTTDKGFLMTMHAEDEDYETAARALKVEGDIGTVNFGSPFVRSGVIANTKGLVVGSQTTGPELVRIQEALGFL